MSSAKLVVALLGSLLLFNGTCGQSLDPDFSTPPLLPDSPFCPVNEASSMAWLKQSSFVDEPNCPAAPTVYRGVYGNHFKINHVLKNMLGSTTTELPSWRFSKMLLSRFPPSGPAPTPTEYQQLKDQALAELLSEAKAYNPICDFGDQSAMLTVRGQTDSPDEPKWKSFGIATGISYNQAASYAGGAPGAGNDITDSIVLQIKEKVPRAAKALGFKGEYYIPIVLPAADISGAWTGSPIDLDYSNHFHFIEKVQTDDQIEIRIRHQTEFGIGFQVELNEGGEIDGRIVECPADTPCVSDPPDAADFGLKKIVDAIPNCRIKGKRYRYVSEP